MSEEMSPPAGPSRTARFGKWLVRSAVNVGWGLLTLGFAVFFLGTMSEGIRAVSKVLQREGLLRPLPHVADSDAGVSGKAAENVVSAAFVPAVFLPPILTAARVRFRLSVGVGVGVGLVLLAVLCALGLWYWEMFVLLPVWWLAAGVFGGVFAALRRLLRV